ncbi:MAG: hypothetical protein IKL44_01990 [Clostridia bacterium]|nr:hypothetical protein [Clostridia bacterium]
MKKALCIILSLILIFALAGCGSKTVYFDKELDSEEAAKKEATTHLPLSLRAQNEFTLGVTTLTIDENGKFAGQYSETITNDKADAYPQGTFYSSNFTGEFAGFSVENDYTIELTLYNPKVEGEKNAESIDETVGIRYLNALPKAFEKSETEFTLFTPEAPKAAVPSGVLSVLPYGTSDNIELYVLYNNETGDIFTSATEDEFYY